VHAAIRHALEGTNIVFHTPGFYSIVTKDIGASATVEISVHVANGWSGGGYISLGDAQSGDLISYDGTNNLNNPEKFKTLTSQDFKIGVRWMLQPEQPTYAPPIMRKG